MKVLSKLYGVADRASRAVEMEREHLEDLLAEARAKFEADRARAVRNDQGGRRAPASVQDRAA